jgi:peptidoglycan hydrolase-like protein with peptidoglycan-binding domain
VILFVVTSGFPVDLSQDPDNLVELLQLGGTISVLPIRASLAVIFSAALVVTPAFASLTTHKTSPSSHSRSARKTAPKSKSHKLHGQQAIDSNRVTQIQQALIREHYLTSEPNGNWDATTQAAMQKFQSDQGWQTRLMPDSRALKKLGLGPDYSGAINARDSSFAGPAPASTIPSSQATGFAAAAGVNQ